MTIESSPQRPTYPGIDLLRFAAAFLVMTFHLGFLTWARPNGTAYDLTQGQMQFSELQGLTSFGWVGVQIFFVISGFVIVYSAQEATPSGFFRSRFLRLVPGAWICATITALTLLAFAWSTPLEIGRRYALTLILWPAGPWVDGVYWTLGVEIAFYAFVWGLLRLRLFDRLTVALAILGLVSTSYWLVEAVAAALDCQRVPILSAIPGSALQFLLVVHGCQFALGGLLFVALCRSSDWRLWLLIFAFAGGGAIEVMHFGSAQVQKTALRLSLVWPVLLWLIAVAAIGASVRWNQSLARHVAPRTARNIGLATYPLYLLHQVNGAAMMAIVYTLTANRWLALGTAFAAMLALSFAIALLWERPLRQKMGVLIERAHRH